MIGSEKYLLGSELKTGLIAPDTKLFFLLKNLGYPDRI
jgi:hypothetical protein